MEPLCPPTPESVKFTNPMPTASPFFFGTGQSSTTPMSTFLAGRARNTTSVVPAAPGAISGAGGPFTLNPATQPGVGAYGTVPGPIEKPPSLYQGAQSIYPGLANLTTAAGGNIAAELAGEFTPQTENALWDTANRFGVASGMPGAGLWSNRFMGNVAGAKEKLQQQGLTDYNAFLADLAKTTDDPNLLASIAARNATMAAAPNPEQAARALADAYRNAQIAAANAARGPGGGTANPSVNLSPGAGTVPRANLPMTATGPQSFSPSAYRSGTGSGDLTDYSGYDLDALMYGYDPTGFWGGTDFLNQSPAQPPNQQPANTFYNPQSDTSYYDPFGDPWGLGGSYQQPENTFYNPQTNTSNYDPFGDVWGLNSGGGGIDQSWGDLDQVATGNNYDPYADMSDEDWWAYLMGED